MIFGMVMFADGALGCNSQHYNGKGDLRFRGRQFGTEGIEN